MHRISESLSEFSTLPEIEITLLIDAFKLAKVDVLDRTCGDVHSLVNYSVRRDRLGVPVYALNETLGAR